MLIKKKVKKATKTKKHEPLPRLKKPKVRETTPVAESKSNFVEGFERPYTEIPTEDLEQLAKKYGKTQLIVLAVDTRSKMHTVNTYGDSPQNRREASVRSSLLHKMDWDCCIEQGSIIGQKFFPRPLLGKVGE